MQRILNEYEYDLELYRCVDGIVQLDDRLHNIRLHFNLTTPAFDDESIVLESEDNLMLNVRGVVAIGVTARRRNREQDHILSSLCICRSMPFHSELWPNAPDSADGKWAKGVMTQAGPFTINYRSASTRPEDAMIQSIQWSCHASCFLPVIYELDRRMVENTRGSARIPRTMIVDMHIVRD